MIGVLNHLISLVHLVLTITRPFSYVLFDFIGRIIFGRKESLPPICDKILLMSATELADHIRKRKLTAEEVMKVYIKRVKEVNPLINACVDERFEEAVSDARSVDKIIRSGNMSEEQLATELPLLGVPFSCKEMIGVKGMSQTNGLLFYKDRKAPSDADVVTEYRKAGAIPYIVTNVPTLSMDWATSNLIFGRTKNPYDKRRTPGGSSGGEGAILTSAGAVIGIGTDIGGSIRIPSAFCGIYGHKASRGIISNQKPWPNTNPNYDPFRSTGPMCRYVQDLRMLMRIASADDSRRLKLEEKVDFKALKIYYMEEIPGLKLSASPDIKKAVRKAINHFEEKFDNHPTKLYIREFQYALDMFQCKFIEADGPVIKSLQKHLKINWYWELIKLIFSRAQFDFPVICMAIIEKGEKDKAYYECLEMYENLKNKLEDILFGNAILLMPTHPEPAPHVFTTIPKLKNIGYTAIFNNLGYPATNIPAGMSYGVPIGLQAVATQYKDHLTIAAAEELDKVFNGWKSPCEVKV